jgi:hypothetical protein
MNPGLCPGGQKEYKKNKNEEFFYFSEWKFETQFFLGKFEIK